MMNNSSNGSLALLTDLYQLTMAYGYWHQGTHEKRSVFHMFFRKNPFHGGYVIAAGLQPFLDIVRDFCFSTDDIDFLGQLRGNDNSPLFANGFLEYLRQLKLTIDVDAIPEGTVVFPNEPLVRITGDILQCQILESVLLNIINFQSLVATKASRVVSAAGGDTVLEFGLRRAQGIDGALAASRAAYIGGCHATSNVLAGKLYGIPVRGTHAHSWVMSFDTELESFHAYARAMPNNCVFLVDTYDTLAGVKHAIEVGQALRNSGHRLLGIRLDSGDLAHLSIEARKMLDEAGFTDAAIVASNDLDESLILDLKRQGAQIAVWGVGTKLITAYDQPALGGVYKLGATHEQDGSWVPKLKLSEQVAKVSTPGILQVRRFSREGLPVGDMIWNELGQSSNRMFDQNDTSREILIEATNQHDLLEPVVRNGQITVTPTPLSIVRQRALDQLASFPIATRRFMNPTPYPVGLESSLHDLKRDLINTARRK